MAKHIIAVVETLQFEKRTETTAAQYTDYSQITTQGKLGYRTTLYEVTTDDQTGIETGKVPYKKMLHFEGGTWNRETEPDKRITVDPTFVQEIDDDLILRVDLLYPNGSNIELLTDSEIVDYNMPWDAEYESYGAVESKWNIAPVTEVTTVGTKPIITTETKVERETVHYSSRTEYDDTKPSTYTLLKTPGVDGYDDVTYLYTYEKGVQISKVEQSRVHMLPPVTQVSVVGAIEFIESTEIETIPIETRVQWDTTKDPSYNVTTDAGREGKIVHTYRTKYIQGVPQPETKEEINVETTVTMEHKIVVRGAKDLYRWLRQRFEYSDGRVVYSAPWRDGETGRGLESVTIQYGISSSDTVEPLQWDDAAPKEWNEGEIVWRRQKVTYDDGSEVYTDANALIGTEMDRLREQANEIMQGYTEIKAGQANFVTYNALGEVGKTAINGGNINTGTIDASRVNVKNIDADNIVSGVLSAKNGYSTLNLNNGTFDFGDGALTWSPTQGLRISGYMEEGDGVTQADLRYAGWTSINGANIQTGTINASAIKANDAYFAQAVFGYSYAPVQETYDGVQIAAGGSTSGFWTKQTNKGMFLMDGYTQVGRIGHSSSTSGAATGPFIGADVGSVRLGTLRSGSNYDANLEVQSTKVLIRNVPLDMTNHQIINQAASSDARLKTDIMEWDVSGIDEVKGMEFVRFKYDKNNPVNETEPDGQRYGVLAQSTKFLQQERDDGYLALDLDRMPFLTAKAVQELILKVESLERRVTELEHLLDERKGE